MKLKKFKDWINSLPEDSELLVIESPMHSIPLREPCFTAIDRKSIKQPVPGMNSGKVISSYQEEKDGL